MKKRSCRMTAAEKEMHERAVRLRKMTDEQLCKYLDELIETKRKAYMDEVYTASAITDALIREDRDVSIRAFLEAAEKARGIGKTTMRTLHEIAEEQGLISYE